MYFLTNRRAALIFFSAALTAFLALAISLAFDLAVFGVAVFGVAVFGFEDFRIVLVVAILPILFF